MAIYEYKVVPAPSKGVKAPGIKGPEARFAHGLEQAMNMLAADGWEYLRADILPSEERQGLTSSHTVYRSVLVFRRAALADTATEAHTAPAPAEVPPEDDTPAELAQPDTEYNKGSDIYENTAPEAEPSDSHGTDTRNDTDTQR